MSEEALKKQEELLQLENAKKRIETTKSFIKRIQKLEQLVKKQALLVAMRELRQIKSDSDRASKDEGILEE